MLFAIWNIIGIILGLIVLIPLLIFVTAIVYGCIKETVNLAIAAANVIQAWIDEKIHKK